MAKAKRKPTTTEYMDLIKAEDRQGMETFIEECFGTHEDYDDEEARSFAEEVLPLIEEEIKTMIDTVKEATPEMIEAAAVKEAANDSVAPVEEAANDSGTDTTKVTDGEATTES